MCFADCLTLGDKVINTGSKKQQRIRVNEDIKAPTVLLVDPEGVLDPAILGPGTHTGEMNPRQALTLARKLKLDLVEVSPNARPPVVRILDYGKYLFDLKKSKKKQKPPKLKEVKFRPVTGEGDYQVKLRNLRGFLEHGDKVKVTIKFRGREITHQELGMELLHRVIKDVGELGQVDQMPKLEGRQLIMIISPTSKK